MKMTIQEIALINNLRGLCFDDLLDATDGISKMVEEAYTKSLKCKEAGNLLNEKGFKDRSNILAELALRLGDANADFRAHVSPEEEVSVSHLAQYMPGVTKMQNSDVSEVIHLFEVMHKYGVKCGLEFQSEGSLDPLFGIGNDLVKHVEYFERSGGPDSIVIQLGEVDFNFELGHVHYFKDISESQIFMCIANDHYSAFFNSEGIPPEGIKEANDYEAEEEMPHAINIHGSTTAEDFTQIAQKINKGWVVAGVTDSTGNDGYLYIDLVKPENQEQPNVH